jgi:hypothetical protein
MDAVLRVRHDALIAEFLCDATELRVVKAAAGSIHTRSIGAFCSDTRASNFSRELSNFEECCASCAYQRPKAAGDEELDPEQPAAD